MLRNAVAVVVGLLMCAPAAVSGQAAAPPSPPTKPFNAPKTPWGDPDLQGIWNFGTITPLERPAQFKDRATLTPEEVARLNADEAGRGDRRLADPAQDVEVAYNSFWWDRGTSVGRTSLIVDPADGRLPPYTPEGRQRRETLGRRGYDSWADRALNERCMVYRPVPVRSSGYNNNNQIVQAPGYVAMLQEQIHEVRIIPLDGRPHLGQSIRPWLGDSRGRWEGNTLVVETTNFHPETNYEGSGPNRTVIERFTLTDANTLSYEFTVNDPTTWTRAVDRPGSLAARRRAHLRVRVPRRELRDGAPPERRARARGRSGGRGEEAGEMMVRGSGSAGGRRGRGARRPLGRCSWRRAGYHAPRLPGTAHPDLNGLWQAIEHGALGHPGPLGAARARSGAWAPGARFRPGAAWSKATRFRTSRGPSRRSRRITSSG